MTKSILRDLAKKLPDLFILYTLSSGPKTGYEVKKFVSQLFGATMSYGTLYPHLYSLERAGLIRGDWSPRQNVLNMQKKEYFLNSEGTKVIRSYIEALEQFCLTLGLGLTDHQGLQAVKAKVESS